MFLSAMVSE